MRVMSDMAIPQGGVPLRPGDTLCMEHGKLIKARAYECDLDRLVVQAIKEEVIESMGLYNMLNGYNPATVLIAPMLTEEDPAEFFPRFRDCYVEDGNIVIYTRVGGGNRTYDENPPHECMYDEGDWHMDYDFGEDKLYKMPTFIRTWDDDFDYTYGYYEFGVPDEWREDFDRIMAGDLKHVSDAYMSRVAKCFGMTLEEADAIRQKDVDVSRIGEAPDWNAIFDKLKGELA